MSQNYRSRLARRISTTSSTHSGSSIADSAIFSQRIVSVDCYTSYPIPGLDVLVSEFRGTEVKRVPVIRIYGSTPRGQKTCTHVHGVFPYIYIEDESAGENFEQLLTLALDNAINAAFNISYGKPNEKTTYQHVFKITKVLGRSFYGYKSCISSFFKIFFYSPVSLKKGVEVLESGQILGRSFQPYEAHIPYILQFFLDYKLYGMNFIHFEAVKFRRREDHHCIPQLIKTPTTTGQGSKTFWDLDTIQEDLFLPATVRPRCRSELEIDVKASNILVSDSVQGKNPGIVDIWLDEKERRRQQSIMNWADITIPQSPDRPTEDFVFSREAELLQILGDYFSGSSQNLAEASQRCIGDMENISLAANSSNFIHSQSSATIHPARPDLDKPNTAMNDSDDEIINLLEDIAIEREENDSILECSQSQAATHYSSHQVEVEDHFPVNNVALDKDCQLEEEWAEDFLSPTTIFLLDKWEQESKQCDKDECASDKQHEHCQCDGQFDDSDDECENPKRRRIDTRTSNAPKSDKHSVTSFVRNNTKNSFRTTILSRSRNRRSATIVMSDSEGSDSDCQVVSVVTPDTSVSKEIVAQSSPRIEIRETPQIIDLSDDEDEGISNMGNQSISKLQKINEKPGRRTTQNKVILVQDQFKVGDRKFRTTSPTNSTSVESHNSSIEKDSGITSFYNLNYISHHNNDEDDYGKNEDSDSSQEIIPASPEHVSKSRRQSIVSLKSPLHRDEFITSIYEFGDEIEPGSPSSQTSSVSVRKCSQSSINKEQNLIRSTGQEETSNTPRASFQNATLNSSIPNTNSEGYSLSLVECQSEEDPPQPKSHDECSSSQQLTELTSFQTKRIQHQVSRRIRREMSVSIRDSLRPSIFPFEIHPLKQAPLNSDIDKWCTERNNNTFDEIDDKREESLSVRYLRDSTKEGVDSRKKLVNDVLRFSRTLIKKREKLNTSSLLTGKYCTQDMSLECLSEGVQDFIENTTEIPELSAQDTNKVDDMNEYSSDEDESDNEVPTNVKAFRFRGAGEGSDNASSGSDSDDDDNATLTSPSMSQSQSPMSPLVISEGSQESNFSSKTKTPKSILVGKNKIGKTKKKRLEFNLLGSQKSPSSDHVPKLNPNESELDTLSFQNRTNDNLILNSSNLQEAKASHEHQFLTTLVVEVHCCARDDYVPDPEFDAIQAIFYVLQHDSPDNSPDNFDTGVFLVDPLQSTSGIDEKVFIDENSMLQKFIQYVQMNDPDILVGYEAEKFSWGYLIQRGLKLGINMTAELSRVLPIPNQSNRNPRDQEQWNEIINGRIVFNLWKLLRHELAVTSYTFESMVLQILHQKVHRFSYKILHNYWNSAEQRLKVIEYFKVRVANCMKIIDKLDLINRTSELARLFGIQFFEVLSRGSQFRVESMMLRLAKPENLFPPSPNPMQRARMKAPEYLPLILEPESKFYADPVAVLDFQSLYPSMMIAYNYCFSTCIGRLEYLGEDKFELGCLSQEINKSEIENMYKKGLLHISPCRVVFAKSNVRKGILSTMLEQILDTRQMVKRSMKKWRGNEALQKVLDSRQLGLKLIANVTYGYTSANFSGRMACVEIADSIVSKGRETLQRAIDYVKENEHIFGGKVLYGDTDSLFVQFPGKTKQEAFSLAQKIVDDVTQANPKPVKLKLEKIYQPCILQTKKRYVGFAYETPDQKEPKYDAKGIETVRRDGCPATAKILEGAIRVLFMKQDEASVKEFVTEQFRKIFLGRVSLSKYTFARKFRGRLGYKPGARVPSLEIAKKLGEKDKRAEPLPKERVPYIVIYGDPWAPLIQRIRRPEEFINDPNLRLNAHYYVEKAIIPALNRCLNLAGLHAEKWLNEMPRKYLKSDYVEGHQKKGTIDQYFKSQKCIKCDSRAPNGFCTSCFDSPKNLRQFLTKQKNIISSKYESCLQTCQDCSKESEMICINMDCPVKHRYLRYHRDYNAKLPKIIELQNRVAVLDW